MVKVRPRGGVEISSTHPLTSALDGVGGQRHSPVAFTPGNDRVRII